MQDNRALKRNYEPDLIDVRRNPYLLDYEEQRRNAAQRSGAVHRSGRTAGRPGSAQPARRSGSAQSCRSVEPIGRPGSAQSAGRSGNRQACRSVEPIIRPGSEQFIGRPGRREAMLQARRRQRARRQKIMAGIWVLCIIAIGGALLFDRNNASAAGSGSASKDLQHKEPSAGGSSPDVQGSVIQGLPAGKFTAHPEWTEDFLTPNEYSRPGDALPEVKDIFVHYTANPGTSAAQNRSYFEQQKDVHMASVSAHFIIGYEGEIIQCVPLDEVAYAVADRNYDSVSIECCYTAEDGSFTKETYDSLISLLAWLTDAYGLDTGHILRHYDSNGKKCPLYYVENEEDWKQLLKDVRKAVKR